MKTLNPLMLTVSSPPHIHCGRTLRGRMLSILLAMIPAALFAVAAFKMEALRVMALSASLAVITEYICNLMMEIRPKVDDLNAFVVGLCFAFLLPASAPWWLVASGSAISIALGKMVFGELGGSPLCAPLVGWAVCTVSWPHQMDVNASMLTVELNYPLLQLKMFGAAAADQYKYYDLLMGRQLGGLGAVQVLGVILGGLWLVVRRIVQWEIPAGFISGILIVGYIFQLLYVESQPSPVFHLLTGSAMFGAFFLAPDMPSSPNRKLPMFLFGLFAGTMTIIIRVYGIYPDGVPFAILLANLCTPLFERIRPRPFGCEVKK
jgi:electron transport complex protein RnfD